MLGCRSGFQSYVRAVSPNVTSVHCFINRFAHGRMTSNQFGGAPNFCPKSLSLQ